MARPLALVPYSAELGDEIVAAVREGAFVQHAAAMVGVSEAALAEWLELGREGREPYATFATELDRAIAEDAVNNQRIINAAALVRDKTTGDWRAAAWNLERKHPALYGQRQPLAETPPPPVPSPRPGGGGDTVYSPFKRAAHPA